MSVLFKDVKINQQFTWNEATWIKVKPVKKSCCVILYNAYVVGNQSTNRVFKPSDQVTLLPDPE